MACAGSTVKKYKGEGKGTVHPRAGHEGPEGEKYSFILSWTSALSGSGWLTPRPGRFTPGKETRYPLNRRLGGPPGPVWTGVGNLVPQSGFDPRTVQSVASRYTDWANQAGSTVPLQTELTPAYNSHFLPPGIRCIEDQARPIIYTYFGKNNSSDADSVSSGQAIPVPLIKAPNSSVFTTAHKLTQSLARLIQSVPTLCLSSSRY